MFDNSSAQDFEAEIHRTCSILERIASQFESTSAEHQAIRDGAQALSIVLQWKSLRASFQKLKSATDGELPDHVVDQLLEMGIDLEEFDADELPPCV